MGGIDSEFIGLVREAGPSPGEEATPDKLPDALPVLGLSDIVIFPGNISPLLVDSASSLKLVDDVVAGDRLLCLVLQKREDIADPGPEDLYDVGCVARVQKMLKYPDNTARILVDGLHRVRVGKFTTREPYLRAEVEIIPEAADDSIKSQAIMRNLQSRFQELLKVAPPVGDHIKLASATVTHPGRLADLIAGALNLQLPEKQRLLETPTVADRLRLLTPLLEREIELITLGAKIQDEVTSTLTKSQRDYFLREQIRVIRRELGETDPAQSEWNTLRAEIEKGELPDEIRSVALRELERLASIPPAVAEHTVLRNYLDWLLQLPWNRLTPDQVDLDAAEKLLDREHYGLHRVKDRLLEFLAVMKLNPGSRAPILCLVGPPGVGKTSLGRSLAEALGRKFARISLGGMRDEAEIRGHRRTYVAAMPGRILQALRRAGSRNPVILLDELDKLGSDYRGDPAAALLEVLDPEQNRAFTDHYLEVPFDLSRALFITTANWLDPVPPALRDRLEIIELPSYTLDEKLQIARRHLLPKQLKDHGLRSRDIKLTVPVLRRIVADYTREAGVRQLNREIAGVLRKAARRLASAPAAKKRAAFQVSPESLPTLLGPPRFVEAERSPINQPGIALGLAWTPTGGELLHIEASRMPGSGKLTLTGSLGEVMKESAHAALSFIRSAPAPMGLTAGDHDRFDLHIHVPAGATPKDGPSAGLALCIALASLASGRPVRTDTAVTGEISLRGRVLPVGGIKEKVLAALRSGIRRVILPEANRKDLPEIPPEALEQVQALFVHTVEEALPLALRPK
ncbi:MAG: endopeptidase La [Verrucomicrobiales bacterium]|nr:endopeptidase La [Verrucomicrobiales bacterium]